MFDTNWVCLIWCPLLQDMYCADLTLQWETRLTGSHEGAYYPRSSKSIYCLIRRCNFLSSCRDTSKDDKRFKIVRGFELTMFNSADIRINSAPFWKTTCFPFYYCSCGVRLEQNNVVLQAQLNPMWYLEQWNFKLKTKVWTKGLICQARSLHLLFIWVSFSSNRPNYFHLNMRCLYGCCKPLFATMAFNPNF